MSVPFEELAPGLHPAFGMAMERWRAAQLVAAEARLEYERVYASAILNAAGNNADVRKAQAEIAANSARLTYERAQIEAKALEHWVMYLRAPRGVHGREEYSA